MASPPPRRPTGDWCSRVRGDQGSLILTLLAAIVIGSLVMVLFAATLSGQRAVQRDRSFTTSVHAADAGLQAALTLVNTKEAEGAVTIGEVLTSLTIDDDGDGIIPMKDKLTFTFEAEKINRTTWHVVAVGSATDAAGRVRTVEAVLESAPLIEFAAFAKTLAGFSGANTADSYNAFTDATDTGRGFVGSNGHIVIGRTSTAENVDGIELHDFFDDPDDPSDDDQDDIPSRVDVCASAACEAFHVLEADGGKIMGVFEKPLVANDWWIGATLSKTRDVNPSSPYYDPDGTRPGSACNDVLGIPGTIPDSLTFRDDGTVGIGTSGSITVGDLPPGVYCAGSGGLAFTETSGARTIDPGAATVEDGLVTDPVIIYTSGPVSIDGQMDIGCSARNVTMDGSTTIVSDCPTPLATRMQIYSNYENTGSGDDIVISQQADVAAILYAPRASCGGGAGVDIYGALVCGSMSNVGGWSFHFDEASQEIKKPEFRVEQWREEVGGSTSF